VLLDHGAAILDRMELAEAEVAEIAGLRTGHVRLGSFVTALVFLLAELAVVLEDRHPALFARGRAVIDHVLVDRGAAFQGLARGEIDVAVVFEHAFEPELAPPDVELVALFDDSPCVLLPRAHPRSGATEVAAADLAGETWIRAREGSAARLVDHVLGRAGLRPALLAAGHGDPPVEARAFVAAGRGETVAHRLNVLRSATCRRRSCAHTARPPSAP